MFRNFIQTMNRWFNGPTVEDRSGVGRQYHIAQAAVHGYHYDRH